MWGHALSRLKYVIILFIIIGTGFLIYIKGGRNILDLTTACILILGVMVFLYWIVRIVRPVIEGWRSIKDTDDSMNLKIKQKIHKGTSINELKIVAATKIEDGESIGAITEYLIQNNNANRHVAENIVKELYNSRQKHFRYLGVLFIGIGGIILIASFIFQEITNELMIEWARWGAVKATRLVHASKLVLWGVAFYFSIKGILRLLFGGRGIKTKRPT